MMRDNCQQRLPANGDPLGTLEPGALVKTWYHLTDTLFSTIAIIDDNATLIERVSYDAYGNARHHRMADLNGDGVVNVSDMLIQMDAWANYGIGDLNRDGVVNTSDQLILTGNWGAALPAGQLSSTDNIIGYAGYIFNAEVHTSGGGGGLYTVRHRVYSPELGRWLTRDPIGYIDGMSLYEYVAGNACLFPDPFGLSRYPHCELCKQIGAGIVGGSCAAVCFAACFAGGGTFACAVICGALCAAATYATGDNIEFWCELNGYCRPRRPLERVCYWELHLDKSLPPSGSSPAQCIEHCEPQWIRNRDLCNGLPAMCKHERGDCMKAAKQQRRDCEGT